MSDALDPAHAFKPGVDVVGPVGLQDDAAQRDDGARDEGGECGGGAAPLPVESQRDDDARA